MDRKYQVFISSTYLDLKEERSAVSEILLKMGCIPVSMEQFPAAPVSQWEYIRRMIDDCDYFILIIAGKYGTEDKEEGIGFTEKEYNYAVKKSKPILAFMLKNPDMLIVSKSETSDSKKRKLHRFRNKVEDDGLLVDYYEDSNDLKSKVSVSVGNCIRTNIGGGWIRANYFDNTKKQLLEMIKSGNCIDINKINECFTN